MAKIQVRQFGYLGCNLPRVRTLIRQRPRHELPLEQLGETIANPVTF